jgi:hypothetical protein
MGLMSLCFWSTAFAEGTPDSTSPSATTAHSNFALEQGDTLWAYAKRQGVKPADWPAFWQDTCRLSSISCTDLAWRNLAVGTAITAPLTPVTQQALASELADLKRSVDDANITLADALRETALLRLEVDAMRNNFNRIVYGAGGFLCILLAGGLWYFVRSRAHQHASDPEGERAPYFTDGVTQSRDVSHTVSSASSPQRDTSLAQTTPDAFASEAHSPFIGNTTWYEVDPDPTHPDNTSKIPGHAVRDFPDTPVAPGQTTEPSSRTATRH